MRDISLDRNINENGKRYRVPAPFPPRRTPTVGVPPHALESLENGKAALPRPNSMPLPGRKLHYELVVVGLILQIKIPLLGKLLKVVRFKMLLNRTEHVLIPNPGAGGKHLQPGFFSRENS